MNFHSSIIGPLGACVDPVKPTGGKPYGSLAEVAVALQEETDKELGMTLYDMRSSALGTQLHVSRLHYLQATHGNRSKSALDFIEHIFTNFDLSKASQDVVEFVKTYKAASNEARMAFYELDSKYGGERRPGAFE